MKLFAFALLALVATAAAATWSGVSFQNGFVHKINLNEPQDSNRIYMALSGNDRHGSVLLNISGPSDYCPDGPLSCGRNVQDTTTLLEVSHKKVFGDEFSLTNNYSPVVAGVAKRFRSMGSWVKKAVRFTNSYMIDMSLPGGIWSKVPIKATFAGKVVDRSGRFLGEQYGFVSPHVSTRYNGTHPYEYLATYGTIDTAQPFFKLAGFRVYSPLGTAENPIFPPSPNAVEGQMMLTEIWGGQLVGKISFWTPSGLVNVTEASFTSDYEFLDEDLGYLRINGGLAHDPAGGGWAWLLDNWNLQVWRD